MIDVERKKKKKGKGKYIYSDFVRNVAVYVENT